MPIARSNTARRSTSRSPLPPFDANPTLKRPFLPPSHYAAAAGIPYTNSEKSYSRSEHSELSEAAPSIMSKDSSMDAQEYHSAFMPISYTSESGATSDSSFEFRVTSGSQYTTSGPDKHATPPKTPVRRRSTHLTGLPQLEAHLLPSLRDTIDRMTRTPSNAGSSSSPSSSTRCEISKTTEIVPSTGSPSSSLQPSSRPVIADSFPARSWLPETSYRAQSHSTTPMEPSTPRLKTPVKSALKSALRAPTPKLFSNPSLCAETGGSLTSGGVSLKSVRSLLSRKSSSASLSETPSPSGNSGSKSTTKTTTPSFQHLRGRSRTDPGTRIPGFRPPSNKSTAPSETNYSAASSDDAKQKLSTSNIPRLQSRFDTHLRTDDSDFDFQYENQERQRRRLVVANAEIFPSSSESEADVKERGWAEAAGVEDSNGEWDFNMNSHGVTNRVGLGLDLPNGSNQKPSSRWVSAERYQAQIRPTEDGIRRWDASKVYDPSSDSYLKTLDADHRRRRAALLGIVSSLDLQPSPVAMGESEESEYCGEDGFAISGSGDLTEETLQPIRADIGTTNLPNNENHSGPRSWRASEAQRLNRSRNPSRMPSYVVSTEDESNQLGCVPNSSRRPRSTDRSFSSPAATSGPMRGRKSPSRSPVVRQDDLASMPAALRRYSVYHRPPSPDVDVRPSDAGRLLKKDGYDRLDIESPDALVITERSYAVAARERRAFGIPLSESVEVYQGVSHSGVQALTHADSDLSSVGSQYWNEDVDELSPGAETLFRKLSGGPTKELERRSYQEDAGNFTRSSVISKRSSVSSIYEDQDPEDIWQDHNQVYDTTSGTVNSDALATNGSIETDCDSMEMQRQDLIQELCQTEEAFVDRLQTFVKLFVLPLRVQDTKTWILGVPSEVARLFDWLDDIMNLHRELLSSLQSSLTSQHPIVEHLAGSIHPFIPRFEIYQPYMVRLASVTSLIQQLVQDEKSDFGEFVDLQEGSVECDGWKFDRFLAEPINRLAQYPSFFTRLVRLTPKTHPDYLSTFLLLHSTEMVVRVMTEVKVREDEYDLIKTLLGRIEGLPLGPQIASRERRLLFHGRLHLLAVDGEEVTILGNALFPVGDCQDYLLAPQNRSTNLTNRTSRLANAVSVWDARRGRSESTSSSSTGTSFETASSRAPSDTPMTSCSTFFSSFRIPPPEGRLSTARLPEQKRILASPSPNPRRPRIRGVPAQVFVFTDLMLMATLNSSLTTHNNDWTILEDIGLTRILGVSESFEQDSTEKTLIVLDTLPVDIGKLNQCPSEKDGPIVTLSFLVPACQAPMLSGKTPRPDDQARKSWISAFRQCFHFTLRSATLLSRSKSHGYDLHSDHDNDTQQTVLSLLASGLPLPKSPSVQLVDFQDGQLADIRKQEREERGWWSLRFQQVFRELQRQDMYQYE